MDLDDRRSPDGERASPEGDHPREAGGPGRWEYCAAVCGLLLLAAQCLGGMIRWAPTYDEFAHLPAGYTYLVRGQFEIYRQNPPLIQMLLGVPLLFQNPELPLREDGAGMTRWEYARAFHALNRDDFDRLFLLGRLPVLLMSLVLAFWVWRWCRRWHGRAGGLLGLSLLVFNPFYIAHSSVATVDLGTALVTTALFWLLARYLQGRGRYAFAALVVCFGLVQGAKFSSLLLFGIVPLLLLAGLRWPDLANPEGLRRRPMEKRGRRGGGLVHLASQCLLLVLGSAVVLCALFAFQGVFTPLEEYRFLPGPLRSLQESGRLDHAPVPLPRSYLEGLDAQLYLNRAGFNNYLLGERNRFGFPSFFLVAFLAKMPLGFLALLAMALPLWIRAFVRRGDLRWVFLLFPVAVFTVYFSLSVTIQGGLRYLLPLLPLVVVFMSLCGAFLWNRGWPGRAALLLPVAVNALACTLIFPHTLAYFNAAWGGPEEGCRVVVSSDLDWGQDLKAVREDLTDHPLDEVQTFLLTEMDPVVYGIPQAREIDPFPSPGWKLVSVQHLINALDPAPDMSWLRDLAPVRKFGYTLHLYQVEEGDLSSRFEAKQLEAFALLNRGEAMVRDRPGEGEALFQEALSLYPQDWRIHRHVAQFYWDRGDEGRAMRHLAGAKRLNPAGEVALYLGRNRRAE